MYVVLWLIQIELPVEHIIQNKRRQIKEAIWNVKKSIFISFGFNSIKCVESNKQRHKLLEENYNVFSTIITYVVIY